MAPITLTTARLDQVMTRECTYPAACDAYLQAVAGRLRGKAFDDAEGAFRGSR
jgi:hypothetical protein